MLGKFLLLKQFFRLLKVGGPNTCKWGPLPRKSQEPGVRTTILLESPQNRLSTSLESFQKELLIEFPFVLNSSLSLESLQNGQLTPYNYSITNSFINYNFFWKLKSGEVSMYVIKFESMVTLKQEFDTKKVFIFLLKLIYFYILSYLFSTFL